MYLARVMLAASDVGMGAQAAQQLKSSLLGFLQGISAATISV